MQKRKTTKSDGRPPTPSQRRRRKDRRIVAAVLAGMAVVLLIAGRDVIFGGGEGAGVVAPEPVAQTPAEVVAAKSTGMQKAGDASNLIDDDGQSMWASPTIGQPLTWNYLPPGVQMALALRPSALAAHPEGEKVLAALGPLGDEGVRSIETICGLPFNQMERLLIGWQVMSGGELLPTLVVYGEPFLEEARPRGARWQAGGWSYYRPERVDGPLLVAGSSAAIAEAIELVGQPPPLRRDVEKLLALTDADRHATLVVAPAVLFGEGRDMFDGPLAGLRGPLYWFLGDSLSAAAVSVHWDENFFAEVIATPTLDAPPGRAAGQLAQRVAQFPELIETYILELNASPHARRVVARLPAMTRALARYTRSGFDRDHLLVRCYLPAIAGHNLLMGAELALAEGVGAIAGSTRPPAETGSPTVVMAGAVQQNLARPISMRMPRDTLEAALAQLAVAIGVEIEIVGADLQLDGITKNQSLEIDLANRPGGEILIEILRRANPDKAATGPADPRQKLVFVVRPRSPGGPEVIFVTTRGRAAERGEKLPSVFTAGE